MRFAAQVIAHNLVPMSLGNLISIGQSTLLRSINMSNSDTALVKYVFLDIVGFSNNRTVEAQSEIVAALNRIVKTSVDNFHLDADSVLYLPTGDGICIALLEVSNPYDIQVQIAISILEGIEAHNSSQKDKMRCFDVRIGVNENVDNVITDINENVNVAGAGINIAQRIMSFADARQILLSQSVHDKLYQREQYRAFLRAFRATIKHSETIEVYQLVLSEPTILNRDVPLAFTKKDAERRFTQQAAYYYAHVVANSEFIRSHVTPGIEPYALITLMAFLAEDSVGAKTSTPFQPHESTLPLPKAGLEENFKAMCGWSISLLQRYSSLYVENTIERYWGYQYSNFSSYNLAVDRTCIEKLKREWPDICNELSIT